MILVTAVLLLEFVQTADAAADDDTAAIGVFLGEIEAAILDCGVRGHQGELSEAVQPIQRPLVHDGFRVEVFHFATEMDLEGRRVELLDGSDAASSGA